MFFLYFLVTVMPLSNHPLFSAGLGTMTVFKYLGILAAMVAAYRALTGRAAPSYFSTLQARCFTALYVIALLSFLVKSLPGNIEGSPMLMYTCFLGLFFVTLTLVDSARVLRWIVLLAIASLAIGAAYVAREWQVGHRMFADYRPGYVVGDSNYYCASALLCIPIAYYLFMGLHRALERVFCIGCLMLILVGFMLCASRGGFVGLAVVMVMVALRSPHRFRDLFILGALLAAFLLFAPVSPLQRILHPGYGDNLARESRLVVWKAGMRMIKENPLTGVGLGNFRAVVLNYEDPGDNIRLMAHNTYIELAAEMGIPVLLIFITMLLGSCWSLETVRRRARQSGQTGLRLCAEGMQAGLLGYAVAAAFLPGEYQKLLWLMIFLTMRMPGLVRRQRPPLHGPRISLQMAGVEA